MSSPKPRCSRYIPGTRVRPFLFCWRADSFFLSNPPTDRAIPPRTFDTPRPLARLFLEVTRLAAFHERVRSDGAGGVRHFQEPANVLKPLEATCYAAGRDRSHVCRPVRDAPESAGG